MTDTTRARTIGALFLISTIAYLTGSGLVDAVINKPAFLAELDPGRMQVMAGLLLEILNAAAVTAIAVLVYPILKSNSESIALGYLSSRIIESVLLLAAIIGPLTLLGLSESFIAAGGDADGYYKTIGDALVRGEDLAFQLAMLALSVGSILFCILLYRTKLVPRLLSLLGALGYIALLASSCLTICGYDPGMALFIPGGLFELILPLWLIFKGWNKRNQ
ncbi:DUF4386 domain-containing protein [Paenibacillus nanensis]|uniref:DUF4386 domain-containing protein n=1 Tax=Paenibacillus nanensis TaxID=393251 RepID=A0A3A1V3F1_9BACL|nr:DUF4386 domain-containing protein [Paenibacillus nanensis]RIX53912.1 DUF4386 domain-containing protein [Paenibacillus nanensis]